MLLIVTAVLGGIASLGVIISSALSWANRKKISEVHLLVNQRLSDALAKIGQLERQVGILSHPGTNSGSSPPAVPESQPGE